MWNDFASGCVHLVYLIGHGTTQVSPMKIKGKTYDNGDCEITVVRIQITTAHIFFFYIWNDVQLIGEFLCLYIQEADLQRERSKSGTELPSTTLLIFCSIIQRDDCNKIYKSSEKSLQMFIVNIITDF